MLLDVFIVTGDCQRIIRRSAEKIVERPFDLRQNFSKAVTGGEIVPDLLVFGSLLPIRGAAADHFANGVQAGNDVRDELRLTQNPQAFRK